MWRKFKDKQWCSVSEYFSEMKNNSRIKNNLHGLEHIIENNSVPRAQIFTWSAPTVSLTRALQTNVLNIKSHIKRIKSVHNSLECPSVASTETIDNRGGGGIGNAHIAL